MDIREKLRNFGILVIRKFWPVKGKGIQRLGILALGIGALLGVSQAGTIQRLITGSAESSATASNLSRTTVANLSDKNATASATDGNADERLAGTTTIVDLIGDSELILKGVVKEVTDGIENGIPYTEVTVKVDESIKGSINGEYTYRQFGLKEPRKMGNGKVNLNVSPAGWSKYEAGQETVLFLYNQAGLTGLRTTVGLAQGKLDVKAGNISSGFDNTGMFDGVELDAKLANDNDKRLLATKKGAANKDAFLSLVRRAVKGNWVQGGKLRHAKK